MSNIAVKRLKREFLDNEKYATEGDSMITLELIDQNYLHVQGTILGAQDTPYHQGHFLINIVIPESYPFSPPKVTFKTPVWHPNISSVTGVICLDILKEKWAASLTLRTVLLSIQALLSCPVPEDPQDGVVASQYIKDKSLFEKTAQYWTHAFASGPYFDENQEQQVKTIVGMGFNHFEAISNLSYVDWDIELASQRLLDDR
ncbi:hypothetical protein A3Q56_01149 [Intoshia linei]|uniref:Uncharacterized protein n=1 Tax=Intoshia linei TaxID=1819745 RepID=A0A177BCB1_9BILA|nr:hypothetical protein A3Q56_01149 [Intoshia linei]